MFRWISVALSVVLLVSSRAEDINFQKVHLVDAQRGGESLIENSFLLRGNAPLMRSNGQTIFAYDTLLDYARSRVIMANHSIPTVNSDIYLVDITFENVFDGGFANEADFWSNASNAAKGRYFQWELLGAPIWASDYNATEQKAMILDGSVWKFDQIPTRIRTMRQMLLDGPPAGFKSLVVYVHCAGGCDRTGEFVAAYRMQYDHTSQLRPIYSLDVAECGRAPDFYASGAIGWYCLTWNLFNSTALAPPMTDCLDAYTCAPFGSCNATGK